MGAFSRSVVAGSVLLVAACASLAGLEEPDDGVGSGAPTPAPTATSGGGPAPAGGSSNDGPQSSGDTSGQDGGTAPMPDAASDAPPVPACLPPKQPNGAACTLPADCCSNACSEDAKCRGQCKSKETDLCNPFDDECCLGRYCAGLPPHCKACRPTGSNPEAGDLKSCCSRTVGADGKCL